VQISPRETDRESARGDLWETSTSCWRSARRAGSAKWQINPGEVDRINCDQIVVSAVLETPKLLIGARVPDTADR
jgi:hypothetical protein